MTALASVCPAVMGLRFFVMKVITGWSFRPEGDCPCYEALALMYRWDCLGC